MLKNAGPDGDGDDGCTTDFTADDMKSYCILLDHDTVDQPKAESPNLDSDSSTDDKCGDDDQPQRYEAASSNNL